MSKLCELDRDLIEIISETAESKWQEKFPDALALYDNNAVVKVIESELRLNGFPQYVADNFTQATLLRALGETFIRLLRRGVLDQFQKMAPTPEAQRQIDEMCGVAPVSVNPHTQAKNTQAAAIDACVADWKTLDSLSFKNRWMNVGPEKRAIFDAACEAGRI